MKRSALARIALSAMGGLFALGACAPVQIPIAPVSDWRVPVEGDTIEPGETLLADVRNPRGTVRLTVVPGLTRPEVVARPYYPGGSGKVAPLPADRAISTSARIEEDEDGRRVLTVQVRPIEDEDLRIDLRVRTPSAEQAIVRNAHGPVELVGVGDAINVHTGLADVGPSSGGSIKVRTERAVRGPVKLMTTSGDIYLYAGGDSAGRIEANSENGTVRVSSRKRPGTGVSAQPSRYRGIFNDGANLFALDTTIGDITVRFADGPWELTRDFDWSGDMGR